MKKYILYSEQYYPAKHLKFFHTGNLISCYFWKYLLKLLYVHSNFQIKRKY